jgi:cyclohexa-1,5-dienecarbonyl-CoA hydratase
LNPNFKNIIYESVDGVAKILVNRPPLNVLNSETINEIISALKNAQSDKNISIIVISSVGDRAFCAGVDIKEHLPDKIDATLELFHKMFHVMADINKPIVAVVNGLALGGGCEVALGSDIVISSDKAQFGQPEISVGAIPTVASVLMPKLIGRKKAFELIFTGDIITAQEAKEIGLVNKVVPQDKLTETTEEIVRKLKEKSPIVLKLVRKAVYQGLDREFKKALDGVTDIYLKKLIKTEDAVEGLKAFLEKRKPQWKNR